MKITLSIALLLITNFLFAQNDTPIKGIPIKVGKDGKVIVGIKPVADSNSMAKQLDSFTKATKITVAKDYPIYRTNMSFWEKCKYWFFWLKKEQPFMFWPLLIMISIWILRLIFKLFNR
jgi:CO dehydrogenase/acetyl-CoA synthase epsilon subunit